MNSRTSISILFLLLVGCEEPPAVLPETSADAIGQVETTVLPVEPAVAPEVATDGKAEHSTAIAEQANEITGKVVGIVTHGEDR